MTRPPQPAHERPPRQAGRAAPQKRSVVLSAIAIVGIVGFLAGVVLTVIGFFAPHDGGDSFTGKAPGMSVTTKNVGLALAFLGALFTGLVAVLRPAAGVLFLEEDRRTWAERLPGWVGPALLVIAAACLVALIAGGILG